MPERRASRGLLACGWAGPILFVVALFVEGAIRPNYASARMFGSLLSLGDGGWQQIANFVASGSLIVLFSFGLRQLVQHGPASRWGPIMIGAVGLGLIGAGVFVTDPALGYPPGAPLGLGTGHPPSWHGGLHLLASLFVFGGLSVACLIFARRFRSAGDRSWTVYSRASGVGMFGFFVAAIVGASGSAGLDGVAGWLQRASIAIGFAWIAMLALRYARAVSATK
jgi:hypothetical protein